MGSHAKPPARRRAWALGGIMASSALSMLSFVSVRPATPPAGPPPPGGTGNTAEIPKVPGGDLPHPARFTLVASTPVAPRRTVAPVASPKRATPAPPRPAPPTSAPPSPPAFSLGRAEEVVAFLRAQVGKPYVYGGNGPGSYDCSGLVKAALAVAGVDMPRTAAEQSLVGAPVPLSALQPGDVLFWDSPGTSHHSVVYIGGGQYIGAENPETGVAVRIMQFDPPTFARRVL